MGTTACSNDDGAPTWGGPVPLRECPQLSFETCDTRLEECQQQLLAIAQCVTGSSATPTIPIRVVTQDELREELEQSIEQPTAEELHYYQTVEGVLIDLDLAVKGDFTREGSIDDLLARADGVYVDAESGITLIDRGTSLSSVGADALLVHELVHALQDADYDLAGLREEAGEDSDAQLALKTLIEGEATWYQYRVVAAMIGHDTVDVDFAGIFADLRRDLMKEVAEDKSAYRAAFGTFPYAFGTNLMYQAWLKDRQGFEAELLADPPRTTRHIIELNANLPLAEPPRAFNEPEASDGFTLVAQDSLGTFLLELCFHHKGLSRVDWLGDRLWIYTSEDGAVAWLWQLALDEDATNLAPAFEQTLPSYVHVEARGKRLFAVAQPGLAPFLLEAGRAYLNED